MKCFPSHCGQNEPRVCSTAVGVNYYSSIVGVAFTPLVRCRRHAMFLGVSGYRYDYELFLVTRPLPPILEVDLEIAFYNLVTTCL